MCKSSLAMTDGQNMRHGSDFFLLDGQYLTDDGRSESVVCAFARKGGKTLKRNGKEYERLSDLSLIPISLRDYPSWGAQASKPFPRRMGGKRGRRSRINISGSDPEIVG